MKRNLVIYPIIVLALCSAPRPAQAGAARQQGHEEDVIVGHNSAGQMKARSDSFSTQRFLPPVNGLLQGWALDDPGFENLVSDDPSDDFFRLAAGANIVLEIVSISPALNVYTPGFTQVLDGPGDTWKKGPSVFHEHPTWHIDSNDPGFVPSQTKWQVTFRLVDLGTTGYAPSPPYTLVFTNVDSSIPTVSEWGLTIMTLLLVTGGRVYFGQHRASLASPSGHLAS